METRNLAQTKTKAIRPTLKIWNAFSTPSCPYAQNEYMNARPTPTAEAPEAIALRMLLAHLTPPSTNTANCGFGHGSRVSSASTMLTRFSSPDRAASSWRPPWLESTIPTRSLRHPGGCDTLEDDGHYDKKGGDLLLVMLLNQGISFHDRDKSMKD